MLAADAAMWSHVRRAGYHGTRSSTRCCQAGRCMWAWQRATGRRPIACSPGSYCRARSRGGAVPLTTCYAPEPASILPCLGLFIPCAAMRHERCMLRAGRSRRRRPRWGRPSPPPPQGPPGRPRRRPSRPTPSTRCFGTPRPRPHPWRLIRRPPRRPRSRSPRTWSSRRRAPSRRGRPRQRRRGPPQQGCLSPGHLRLRLRLP